MPDEPQPGLGASPGRTTVWLVLVPGRADDAVAAFWERDDAVSHEAALLATGPSDIAVAQQVVVQGERRRCRLCREPVVLDDLLDPESWRHTDDANDLGDHTAEV